MEPAIPTDGVPVGAPLGQRLPDFLILGAAKCGTTALSEYLRLHPQVFFSSPKETQFFSREYARGLGWYAAHFDSAEPGQIAGEGSPQYTRGPVTDASVAERIHRTLPAARLIYLVREPVARIVSHYAMFLDLSTETRPIDVAIRENPILLDATRYRSQIDLYLRRFCRESVLVLDAGDLLRQRAVTYARICEFLEIDTTFRPPRLGENIGVGGAFRTQPGAWLSLLAPAVRSTGLANLIPLDLKLRARGWVRRPIRERDLRPSDVTLRFIQHELKDEMLGISELLDEPPEWARP